MVTLVLAALVLRPSLTLDVGPVTADRALEQLSSVVGEHLKCSPGLRREILMVRVKGAPWGDVKRRIAKVAWARWSKEGADWVLERPASLARRQEAAIIERRAQLIKEELGGMARGVAPWSEGYVNGLLIKLSSLAENSRNATRETESRARGALIDAGTETPAGRALRRLLTNMDPREIAAIGVDEMAVYSDQPTALEKILPGGTAEILREFQAEQHDFAIEMERRSDLHAAVDFLDPRFNTSSANPAASRFVLTFRRLSKGRLEAILVAADPDGWHVASARQSFVATNKADGAALKDFPSKEIALSQRAKDFALIFMVVSGLYGGDIGDRDRAYRLAREWMPTFADAEKIEPMQFVVGDALSKTTEVLDSNLVADLPDDLLTYIPLAVKGKSITTAQIIGELTSWGMNTTGSYTDGWLELMPADPAATTADRLDRTCLAKLARTIDAKKAATLDDLADYAAGQPGGLCFRSIDQAFAGTYSRSVGDTGAGLANYYYANVLRFWGSLSPQQRDYLRRSGSIRVSGLTEQARHWLSVYVYGVPRAFATNFMTPFTPPPTSLARRNVKASPYEGLTNGIPMDALITGQPISEPMLRIRVKDDEDADTSTPEVLGAWFAGEKWPLTGDQSPLLSIAYAYAPMVKISFDFGRGYTAWVKIGDDVSSYTEAGKYDALPEDIRKRIESRYAEAAAQKAKDDAQVKGRTIPPYSDAPARKYSSRRRH